MKILFFTDTFLPEISGVVTSVVNFSKRLAERGHEIFIFTTQKKSAEKIDLGPRIHLRYFKPMNFLIKYPDFHLAQPEIIKTFKDIREIKPDIIHLHIPSPQTWMAIVLARHYNIPVIATYHTLLPKFLGHTSLRVLGNGKSMEKLAWAYTKTYYNRLNLIITPSKVMKQQLARHGVKKKIEVVSNGVDETVFSYNPIAHDKIRLLHLGRISDEKNIDQVVQAFKLARQKNDQLTLSILGDGPALGSIKKLVEDLNLGGDVTFISPQPLSELPKFYNAHDMFVTASPIETEGIVILEAMTCGLPIVGCREMAVPHLVRHNKNGYLFENGDIDRMAEYMQTLAMNVKKRKRFSRNSLEMSKRYALKRSIDKIEGIYKKLIKKNVK
ncbi:MAG: glycosyltransferase [Patescibacteria group bacterium]